MRNLNDKQIAHKLSTLKESYQKLFGEIIPMHWVESIMEEHLRALKKEYILKYLGDYNEDVIVKIVKQLKEDSHEGFTVKSIPVPDIGPRAIEYTAGPTATVEQAREEAARIQSDHKQLDRPKTKRKRKKRSDAGKRRAKKDI